MILRVSVPSSASRGRETFARDCHICSTTTVEGAVWVRWCGAMDVPGVAEAVAGQNPGSVLFHKRDGFFYHVREIRGRRARMQCRHYSKGCRSTATVNLVTGLLRRLKPHNHAPDRLLLDDEALRREMMEDARANNFAKTARQILNEHRLRYVSCWRSVVALCPWRKGALTSLVVVSFVADVPMPSLPPGSQVRGWQVS